MPEHLATRETIAEARAAIAQAAKIDRGRRAMKRALQHADMRLADALDAFGQGDADHARDAVNEAVDLLRTDEARYIAEDAGALEDAVRLLASISW